MITYDVMVGSERFRVVLEPEDDGYRVQVDDTKLGHVSARHHAGELRLGNALAQVFGVAVDDGRVHLQGGGHAYACDVLDPRRAGGAGGAGGAAGEVHTQMPGAVVRVLVEEGQSVEEGDILVVVEAMKMENEFTAPTAGVVGRVAVQAGQTVESGALLVSIKAEE